MRKRLVLLTALLPVLVITTQSGFAQANLPLYTDNLVNAFQNWSWATVNLAVTSPTHSGTHSISVVNAGGYQALYLEHPNFNTAPYGSVSFWVNGGAGGGQSLTLHGVLNGSDAGAHSFGPLVANTWQQITMTTATLGINNKSNCSGIWIQGGSSAQTVFYVDDVQFVASPAPAVVHIAVNATNTIRSVDSRWFGVNTAVWDSFLDSASTSNALKDAGCEVLRFPGGSLSDTYDWVTGKDGNNTRPMLWTNFIHLATNAGVQAFITVNYGTGTSNKAADWVRSANITNQCNFKYWEIGNECYGTWETDSNSPAHDPYTYALRAAGYMALMRAADPTIKIGIVGAPGEDSYINDSNHSAFNSRTGQTHYGWTPVVLSTLKSLGVTPDFLVHHVYPQYTPSGGTPPANDSDPLVLQAGSSWASDAADLRQQITDYMGTAGTNVELTCTENNSDSGALGRQLTSIVNGLYVADNMGQLMKTEFNSYLYWDLRNGRGNDGTFDPTLYGWRTQGDEGLMYNTNSTGVDKYPSYYGFKMMQYLARPGDTILNATSDYLFTAAYAARKANGSLTLLLINKDSVATLAAQIALANFTPASTATVQTYAIAQDDAERTNGPVAMRDIQTSSIPVSGLFTNNLPPYSLTLITFSPGVTVLPTTLNLTSGANPSTYGDSVTFTATVQTNGTPVGGIAGETVGFYNGAALLGSGTLDGGGQAGYSTTPTQLSAGTSSITAVYSGDSGYAASTNSPTLSQGVSQAAVTILSGITANDKVYDGTTGATISSNSVSLDGIVPDDAGNVNLSTNGYTAAFLTVDPGTFIGVNVAGLSLTGGASGNYSLNPPAGLSADILALVMPGFSTPALSGPDGNRQLQFSGQSGQSYKVLATSDLSMPFSQWTVLTTGTFGAGPATFTDTATGASARFYIIVSP